MLTTVSWLMGRLGYCAGFITLRYYWMWKVNNKLVYKHAVSTIVPFRNINLQPEEENTE